MQTIQHTDQTRQGSKSRLYYYSGALLVAFAIVLFLSIFTMEIMYGYAERLYTYSIGIISLVCLVGSIMITHSRLKNGREQQLEYTIISALRFVTSSVMLGYAFTKLHNGHMYLSYYALDSKLNDINDFETVWSFYGRYSSFQALIGLLELIPSLFLLFRRTAFIGAAMMFPVVANVVILNAFYKIGGLTFQVSLLVMIFTIYILYSYKDAVIEFLKKLDAGKTRPVTLKPFLRKSVSILKFLPLGLFAFMIVIKSLRSNTNKNLIKGGYELVEFKKNDHRTSLDSLPADAYRKIYFEKRRLQNSVLNKAGIQGAGILFHAKDSLRIAYRNGPLDSYVEEDTSGVFKGTYQVLNDSELVLKGHQKAAYIEAKYKKLPLREFDYWWE